MDAPAQPRIEATCPPGMGGCVRLKREEELRIALADLETLFRHEPVGMYWADDRFEVRRANPAFCELLGRPEAALIGRGWEDGILPADRPGFDEARACAEAGDGRLDRTFRIVRPDASVRWVRLVRRRVEQENAQDARLVGFVLDVTDACEAEARAIAVRAEQERRTAQIEETAAALRVTLGALEQEKSRLRRETAAGVAHVVLPLLERLAAAGRAPDQSALDVVQAALETLGTDYAVGFADAAAPLTAREQEICHLIRAGLSSKAIAGLLGTSFETVRTQRRSIRRKLRIRGTGDSLETSLRARS